MKKILVVAIALVTTVNLFGQEFLGVKVDGKRDALIAAFKLKGFKVMGDGTKDLVLMEGIAAGKEVKLAISCTPTTKTVWRVSVYLPERSTWSALKQDYEDYLEVLTKKYGQPSDVFTHFSSPYDEGDGYEMTAVAIDKCGYSAFWAKEKGVPISIDISKMKRVRIAYENPVNSDLDNKERDVIANKTF